ncbi:MAG: hypothetical protein KKC78_04220, partial [Proteobacteria bacterium]|nr:hypothetical protein [Pseudomonadota bacterium]
MTSLRRFFPDNFFKHIALPDGHPLSRLPRLGVRLSFYLTLLAASAFYLIPIYILVMTGLKPYAEANLAQMWQLPSTPSLES